VKLQEGMRARGITGAAAEEIPTSIASFALYGFPESHAASFALLAYASAWLKAHHPAAFTCALLNNQPMGFYHPATLVKDAQRHGARFLPVDVTRSDFDCALEGEGEVVRLGLRYVAGLRAAVGKAIAEERKRAPFASLGDLADRIGAHRDELEALAEAGALNAFGLSRRSALWQVARFSRPSGPLFPPETEEPEPASPLVEMTLPERLAADMVRTGLTVGPHPFSLQREALRARGVRRAVDLRGLRSGERVRVAGAVICRQRPGTAKGFVFLTLEDETGLSNVVVEPGLFRRHEATIVRSPALEVDGVLQAEDALTVRAVDLRPVRSAPVAPSHDFR
jgi:error-prone DNA polymerase